MTPLFLTRARLKQNPSVTALARLLVPDGGSERLDAAHRLVWALFSDGADRRRDFLWRQDKPGHFMVLSSRPPNPLHDIFEIEHQPFEPALAVGDPLRFRLHANAVVARSEGPGQRGKRHDVVMDALRHLPPGPERAEARLATVVEAGNAWLATPGWHARARRMVFARSGRSASMAMIPSACRARSRSRCVSVPSISKACWR